MPYIQLSLIHSTVQRGRRRDKHGARLQKTCEGDMSTDEKVRKEQMGERTIGKEIKALERGQKEEIGNR